MDLQVEREAFKWRVILVGPSLQGEAEDQSEMKAKQPQKQRLEG